ncbi:NADPH-dependent FMN reductase [Halegenticoccus tardaugens]|uniref:NADPH-dependent FMN reductase n=1 Tax=Halegenticoccus tardaugens TaxID=2071624 RepID=UPI00100A65F0|nr:NADPH-dependent FMN reductase [Halegenticoccus tardaugens]
MTTVVAVCGSRRDGSYTRAALRYALDAAAEAGADTDFIDLGAVDLPLYHPDIDEQGDSPELMRRMREADGVVVGSPVYHGSYSSTFKNFHDYCSFDEYENTVAGLLAVAGGGSYGSTLDHMRITIRGVHGLVVPHQVGIRSAYEKFEEIPSTDRNGDGVEYEFVDEPLRERTEKLGRKVAEHAALLRGKEAAVEADD